MRHYDDDFDQSPDYQNESGSGYSGEFQKVRARRGEEGVRPRGYGFPVRGYRAYDLDYGSVGGPTTDYSGRVGYPVPETRPGREGEPGRDEVGGGWREDTGRGRTLYGGVPPEYPRRRQLRPRQHTRRRGRGWEGRDR